MINFEHKSRFCADLLAELSAHRVVHGLSETALSKRIAGHEGLFKNLRSGSLPRPDRLQRIADELGWEFYLGPARTEDAGQQLLDDLRDDMGLPPTAGPRKMREALADLQQRAASRVSTEGISIEHLASELAKELSRKFRPPVGYTEIEQIGEDDQHHRDDAEEDWTLPRIDALTRKIQQQAEAQGAPLSAEKLLELVQNHVRSSRK